MIKMISQTDLIWEALKLLFSECNVTMERLEYLYDHADKDQRQKVAIRMIIEKIVEVGK